MVDAIREGHFQRSLSLLTAVTSIVSGLEVAYEHYRGRYSRRVMYTPVILSVLLAAAGSAAVFSGRAARTILRLVSLVTLIDAGVGFYFHVRGIHRKPGGWRLPMTNIIMGPPIFARCFSAPAPTSVLSLPTCNARMRRTHRSPAGTPGLRAFCRQRKPRTHLRRAGYARRQVPAAGRHRHRNQRPA